jgi:tetratricopeptide (TPR) repeat protein
VALEPDEANAYDTLGDVLMAVDADSARAAYELAVAHKTNFVITIAKLSQLAAARGDFATARNWADRVIASDDPRYRADARLMLGALEIYQGRFAAGERAIDRALALGTHEHVPPRELGQTHAVRAQLLRRKGEREAALAELAIATRLYPRSYQASPDHLQPERVRILLELGRVPEARALVDSLAAAPAHPNANMRYPLFVAQAILALHDGDPARARLLLERPDVAARATTLMVATRWADAMTALGEPRRAAQRLEAALVTFIAEEPVATVECLARAAQAWDAAGEPARAAACWERFLAAWGDADWPVPEAVLARQRLAALRTGRHAATPDPIDAASALD